MRVSELMTSNPHGMQVGESLRHAADIMAKQNVGAVLVYDGPRLEGIVTDRDLVIRALANGVSDDEPVRSVMTPQPIAIAPDAGADEALSLMVHHRIGRLCVSEGDRVVGIVTFGDLSPLAQLVADGLARKQSTA